jgi:hypothetical protein
MSTVVDAEHVRQIFRPDVAVFDAGVDVRLASPTSGDAGVAIAEPITLVFPSEPVTEGRIEIHDLRNDDALVTVIDVLSPTHKCDLRGRAAYVAKRTAYIAAKVNLVEIDLLRAGDQLIGVPFWPAHEKRRGSRCSPASPILV